MRPVPSASAVSRRLLLATALAIGLPLSLPAHAEIAGLEIMAPAGPGGGYDQLARATQQMLEEAKLASGVQVQNVPGAGGTIGLAQLSTKGSRNPSPALGSPDHILCALIVKAAGGDVAKMNHIVAGAGGEMLAQVMGGHLTVVTGGLNEMAQQIGAGKLRALGISSPERLSGVDIPTFKEQGIDVELVNWRGLMASAKMKPAEKEALDAALGEMVKSEGWQALLKERGWVDMYQPAAEFAAFLEPERGRIETILKDVGLAQ